MSNITVSGVYGVRHQYWKGKEPMNAHSIKTVHQPVIIEDTNMSSTIDNFTGYSSRGDAPPATEVEAGSRIDFHV